MAIGIAVLRYRLYNIDRIINRTLVYGALTATLVALYFGGIVVLQRLFVLLTGERSTLAVVASTLVIAALFQPLRLRIQSFIDRRFYRSKYDTTKTLEAFSAQLRNETDLDALSDDLVGATAATDGYGTGTAHALAVADLSRLVGMEFGLGEGALEALALGALLHDLGKLGVEGTILQKVGPLARWEVEIIKGHPDIGARMVEPLWCLRRVAQAIRHHHEHYDGGGYPDGLEGEEIPLAARIVAAADAYDVMVRGRPYADVRLPTEAIGELLGKAGGQFDAGVVAALARVAV